VFYINKKKLFTLLELLIAVIIFMLVSVIVATVYNATIKAYKKGTEHIELSQSLSGTFMVMESDLQNVATINDKEMVFFKPEEFSFIATGEGNSQDKDYTYLQVIKYTIDEHMNMLFKSTARYPDDINHIDDEPVLFLENLDDAKFEYIYKKQESDTEKSGDEKEDDNSKSENQKENDNSKVSTDDKEDSGKVKDIKIPFGIKVSGEIYSKNRKLGEYFQTTVMVPFFVIQKSTDSDSGKKDDKDNKDSKNEKK
jgi:Tfp pilus assembly protein PilE